MHYFNEDKRSDITFIGSGISSSFTILNLLDKLGENTYNEKIVITIIDKYHEFYTGIPYGLRSGSSVHLITCLKKFLPEPERGEFIEWLIDNRNWLLEEFKKEGGNSSADWVATHADVIENNNWDDLFIPRYFFGCYIKEKVKNRLSYFKDKGLIDVNYINSETIDLDYIKNYYKITFENNETLISEKVILSVGALPVKYLWKKENLIKKDNLLFINNPYKPQLQEVLQKIIIFLEKRSNTKTNVLIIGANASGLEMIYKLNDLENIKSKINKFILISTQGILPDTEVDEERQRSYEPVNLIGLADVVNLTAKMIAEATHKDLDFADKINLRAASTVDIISSTFGSLLSKLNEEELKIFACKYGNNIGRRQRCAGFHYFKTIKNLKEKEIFNHLAGKFVDFKKNTNNDYFLEYLETKSAKNKIHDDVINIVVNCGGSTNLSNDDVPELLKNLMNKGYCVANDSKIGFEVNKNLEAHKNLHIVGPLLSGNIIKDKAVWHVEHCGRIIWLSDILSEKISNYFKKNRLIVDLIDK